MAAYMGTSLQVASISRAVWLRVGLQEEAAKAGKIREQTVARLQQLEKQKANVELARDELKARGRPWFMMQW
jgi:hypothetical protein